MPDNAPLSTQVLNEPFADDSSTASESMSSRDASFRDTFALSHLIAITRKFGSKAAALVGARAIAMIFNFVSFLLLSRWAGPEGFAGLASNLSLLVTIAAFFALGLPLFALRAASLGQDDAVNFSLALNVITSTIVVASGIFIALTSNTLSAFHVIALAIAVAFEKNYEMRVGLGVESGANAAVNSTIVFQSGMLLAVVIAAGVFHINPIPIYVYSRLIASFCAASFLRIHTKRWRARLIIPRDGSLKSLSGFIAADVAWAPRLLDVWLVGTVSSSYAAGLYAAVNKFTSPVSLFTNSLRTVLLGEASKRGGNGSKAGVILVSTICVLLCVPLSILSHYGSSIISLLLGPEYAGATGVFALVILSIPPIFGIPLIGIYLQAAGNTKMLAGITGLWNILFLIGILIASVPLGATGAGIALLVTSWGRYLTLAVYCYFKDLH